MRLARLRSRNGLPPRAFRVEGAIRGEPGEPTGEPAPRDADRGCEYLRANDACTDDLPLWTASALAL